MQLNATSLASLAKVLALSACVAVSAVAQAQNQAMRSLSGGVFQSVLPPADGVKNVTIESFKLDATLVTNAQFAKFVAAHPEWQRDRVARVFADQGYLRHWTASSQHATSAAQQPVVHVSWFAASAYCEARGARLPAWYEWEYAAAASQTQRDARSDPAWRQQILDWYSKSGRGPLPDVAKQSANAYGIHDLHGMVWEWIDDLSAMMVSGDNRQQSDPDVMRFCGAGALSMEQKENYAILMRIAMLSSMQANYTSATMGFRCATGAAP